MSNPHQTLKLTLEQQLNCGMQLCSIWTWFFFFILQRVKTSPHSPTLSRHQTTNLDSSKLKEFADNNFKFDGNGRKLSKRVENTVGKGEIARYEQFLLFPQCFQKACFPGASKDIIVWERLKLILTAKAFENILENGDTSCNCIIFSQCFLPPPPPLNIKY